MKVIELFIDCIPEDKAEYNLDMLVGFCQLLGLEDVFGEIHDQKEGSDKDAETEELP